jgi:hypothetical protein
MTTSDEIGVFAWAMREELEAAAAAVGERVR